MMKLRLIEQACGCSVVRGGGCLKVHARRCLRNKVAAMVKLRLIEQAGGCFMLRGGGGLKVRARLCLSTLVW